MFYHKLHVLSKNDKWTILPSNVNSNEHLKAINYTLNRLNEYLIVQKKWLIEYYPDETKRKDSLQYHNMHQFEQWHIPFYERTKKELEETK